MNYLTVGLFLCVALVAAVPQKTYKGYKVYEVTPKTIEEVKILRKWMIEEPHFDFWNEPAKNLEPVHIMVSPKQAARLTVKFRKNKMDFKIHLDNISKDIEDFIAKESKRRSTSRKVFDINDFNTLEDIMDWLQNTLVPGCANGVTCEYSTASEQSVEGRDIPIVTMSVGSTGGPVYLMDATIHAREWLATATILKIMDHIQQGGTDISDVFDGITFVFMPVLNPDGYSYTWTNERLWRKNRSPNSGGCVGVDLNRNCDYMFGEEGVSTNPCSDLYCGPFGNSEPETLALDAVLAQYAGRQRAYITFHSYGYMWMHPWGNTVNNAGFTCERADDHDDMFAVADATADAIEAAHNTRWDRGTSCEVIYETTGATDDYAKAIHGWKYPFTPELRGNSFIVDNSQIQPSFEEVWAGIVAKEGVIP